MKAYGIPRIHIDGDVLDCATYGLKSSRSSGPKFRHDSGGHGQFRNKEAKGRARRYFKRVERQEGEDLCRNGASDER